MAKRIIDDERPIASAWSESGEFGATVGYPLNDPTTITKIEPYHENGEVAPVVWLLVWNGDVIVSRLNAAKMAEIVYQT